MPFRFEEFNTLCEGGLKGASDTLGAALFVIDAAFSLIKVSWCKGTASLAKPGGQLAGDRAKPGRPFKSKVLRRGLARIPFGQPVPVPSQVVEVVGARLGRTSGGRKVVVWGRSRGRGGRGEGRASILLCLLLQHCSDAEHVRAELPATPVLPVDC